MPCKNEPNREKQCRQSPAGRASAWIALALQWRTPRKGAIFTMAGFGSGRFLGRSNSLTPSSGWLGRRFIRHGLPGKKINREAPGVGSQQLLDALRRCGLQDEPRVVVLLDAIDNLRIGVGGGVGLALPRQRNDHPSVVFAWQRELVRQL